MIRNLFFHLQIIARFAVFRFSLNGGVRNLVTLFILPPLLLLVLGQVLQEAADPRNVPVVAVDLDRSDYSHTVLRRLEENPVLELHLLERNDSEAVAEAKRMVVNGRKEAAYIIHSGFMDDIIAGEFEKIITVVDSPASLLTELLSETIAGEVIRLTANVSAADTVIESLAAFSEYIEINRNSDILSGSSNPPSPPGLSEDDIWASAIWSNAWRYADSHWEPRPIVQLQLLDYGHGTGHGTGHDTGHGNGNDTGNGTGYDTGHGNGNGTGHIDNIALPPENISAYRQQANNLLFLLGILSVFLMLLTVFMCDWLISDRIAGLWPRLKSYAAGIAFYLAGNTAAVLMLAIFAALFALWPVNYFLPVAKPFTPPLILLLICYIAAVLGLSLLLASLARNPKQFQLAGIMATVITALLAGSRFFLGELAGFWHIPALLMPQYLLLAGAREYLFSSETVSSAIYLSAAALLGSFLLLSFISYKVVTRYD